MLQRKISHDKRKISHAATKTGYSRTNQYFLESKLGSALDIYWASQVALMVKNPPANADERNAGLIPGSERSPGGGLQYLCLEKPMDGEAW